MANFIASSSSGPGGFFKPSLPSPAPSSASSVHPNLPTPRTHPLRSGSRKEDMFINYVDNQMLSVTRRYAKKFHEEAKPETSLGIGYTNFGEVAKDLEGILDVVWISGTPHLQIPFLLSIASHVPEYLPAFPFSPRRTFNLITKLDLAFSSLIEGKDPETGQALASLEGKKKVVNTTQSVRIKGIVERTRVAVVRSLEGATIDEGDVEDEVDGDDYDMDDLDEKWEMEVARVYEKTLVALGETLTKPDCAFNPIDA